MNMGFGESGLVFKEPVIFSRQRKGRIGASIPDSKVKEVDPKEVIPRHLLREKEALFPELSEPEIARHFTRLSQWNIGIDQTFYPLGSCTMKYNPKINEWAALFSGFSSIHPYTSGDLVQGALGLMYSLGRMLCEIAGMDEVSLQPAAGAQGELAALLMIRAYYQERNERRDIILVPDTAHGTNPASSALTGYKVREIKSTAKGILSWKEVKEVMSEDVAAIMITNPNTLGLFEEEIKEISQIVHEKGGQVFLDGANLNSLLGIARPGEMGVDIMQFNLHKTFSTPHGGGGPGSGPIGVKAHLSPYLPKPVILKKKEKFYLDYKRPNSIGRVRSFLGNFSVMVKAYTYILEMGSSGLKRATELAILNANYLLSLLRDDFHVPYDQRCMHEFVITDRGISKETGVTTLDIAKRLIDYGFHPPTIYFPLVVKGALMIEPTETETKETLDEFAKALLRIKKEAFEDSGLVLSAPHITRTRRLDEVYAARKPCLRWHAREDSNL